MSERRDLTLLCVASATAMVGWSMVLLLVPLLALRFGASPTGVGALIAAGSIVPLVLAVPTGTFVDRWGARRVVLLGFAGSFAAMVPMAIEPSLAWLVVAYVLGNAVQNAYFIGAQALVAALGRAGKSREAAYGWWTTAMAAGQVVGPFAAGLLLDAFGPGAAFGGVAFAVAMAFALMLNVRQRGRAETVVPPFRWRTGAALVRDRTVGIAILTSSAAVWAMTVHATFLPVHLESLAVPAVAIGALLSLRAVASVAVRPVMPRVVAALGGRERTVVFTLLALALGLAGVALSPSLWVLGIWVVLFGVGGGLSQPVSMVMVADRVAPRERGTALGVRLTFNRLAQLLAPVVLTALAERSGLISLFVAHALLVGVAALALVVWVRRTGAPAP